MKRKKIIAAAAALSVIMAVSLSACGGGDSSEGGEQITVAHQYGMAYAPFEVMKEQKLIEKYYDGVEVEWATLNSGSAINEGFASGDVDVGGMGVAPAITGVTSGVPYKIAANMSAQPHKIMSNDDSINSLADIGSDDRIALVNIGSIQHILLAMASEAELATPMPLTTILWPCPIRTECHLLSQEAWNVSLLPLLTYSRRLQKREYMRLRGFSRYGLTETPL